MSEATSLRPRYDLELPDLERDSGSRGRVYRSIPARSHVLDVGCDTGRFGAALKSGKQCRVDGIEPDARAAAAADPRLDCVLRREIQNETSFDGLQGYDAALFLDVLEHLRDPWAALRGARKALRGGGTVHVVVPNVAHVSVVRRLLRGEFEYQEQGTMDRTHLRWFTRQSLRRCLRECGYVDEVIQTVPVVPWLGEHAVARPLARSLAWAFPDLFAGSLIGVGRAPE